MPPAPLPPDEPERLRALHALRILDTPREERFDIFIRLARRLLDVPIAAISLVDADRQWFKAIEGLDATETPREVSFCAHAILTPDRPCVVEDARADPRFADNPVVVHAPYLRFYAGMPLRTASGHAVGGLCVADTEPRRLDLGGMGALADLARGVVETLSLHQALIELDRVARTDPLTGVLNRSGFEARAEAALAAIGDEQEGPALLCLDLDRFKEINDLLGHPGGDAALVEAARRLVAAAGADAIVGRMGGDEFAVLVPGARVAETARRILQGFEVPATIIGQAVPLRTSMGVAFAPAHGRSVAELFAAADAALYRAKAAGRGTIRFAQAADPAACPSLGRHGIARRLRAALEQPGTEPFAVVWQPIVDARTARPQRYEALIRWPQPDGGSLPPAAFLPIAECNGLMPGIDRWMLHAACRAAAGWWRAMPIAVNLSAVTFALDDPPRLVRQALEASGLEPGRLTVEITETVMVHDRERVRRQVEALKRLGVHVALDDFGAGHASFGYMRDFPFDRVKIDRGYVALAGSDPRAISIIKSVVALIRDIGGSVVAEGIETEEQARLLRRVGVDAFQGFLYGTPGPIPQEVAQGRMRSMVRAA